MNPQTRYTSASQSSDKAIVVQEWSRSTFSPEALRLLKDQVAKCASGVLTTVAAMSTVLGFVTPARAQTAVYNFSNVPGVGANIDTSLLPEAMGSVRLSLGAGGDGPLQGALHRGWFGIQSPTDLVIPQGQVRVTWTEYLAAVVVNSGGGVVGSTFEITPTTLGVVGLSYGVLNPGTNRLEAAFAGPMSEPSFLSPSSALTITRTGERVLSVEGFGNTSVWFDQYLFSYTYSNPQEFVADWFGVNYEVNTIQGNAAQSAAQRVYAAAFEGAGGRYSERISSALPRQESVLENGPALGVTIEVFGPLGGSSAATEPGGLALLMLGGVPAALYFRSRR